MFESLLDVVVGPIVPDGGGSLAVAIAVAVVVVAAAVGLLVFLLKRKQKKEKIAKQNRPDEDECGGTEEK